MEDTKEETKRIQELGDEFFEQLIDTINILFDQAEEAQQRPTYVINVMVYQILRICEERYNYNPALLIGHLKETLEKLHLQNINEEVVH
jgi:hypothetical protein|tara:strand:- start:167 stop:433 length:267 start_codon:yes stop_codon:yes gene_type:complete